MIYGPSKGGKTWMGLEIGAICPFERANARCLVVSNEMPLEQIYRRVFARLCRMDYSAVVMANLDEIDRSHMFETLDSLHYEQIELAKNDIVNSRYRNIRCVKPSPRFGGGVNAIRAEIDAFKPDIVFIDGVYLMVDDRTKTRDVSWKTITNITQDVKGLASEYNIPILGTTQSNREGAKRKAGEDMGSYNDVGFGLSAIQDADMVIRVQKIPTKEGEKILVTLPAMRESRIDSFTVNFVPVIDFSLHQVNLTQEQVEQLQVQALDIPPDKAKKFRSKDTEGEPWM
jgi:replicative DNA helicase